MNIKVDVIQVDSISELCSPSYPRKIIDQQTFYIYKRLTDCIKLYIVDGIKTDPPLSPTIALYDPEVYSTVFTIPKGVIHKHHSDWINQDTCNKVIYGGRCVVLTERDDNKAIDLFENYLWRC